MNLNYLGYVLLIGPVILILAGIVWCCLVINSDI